MIAMHVHRQLWLIILLLGIREKVNTGELFFLCKKYEKESIILTVSFQLKTYHLTSSCTILNAVIAMHVHKQSWLIILLLGFREKVNTGEFSFLFCKKYVLFNGLIF